MKEAAASRGSSRLSPLVWDRLPPAPLGPSLAPSGSVPGGAGRAGSQRQAQARPTPWWWRGWQWLTQRQGAREEPCAAPRLLRGGLSLSPPGLGDVGIFSGGERREAEPRSLLLARPQRTLSSRCAVGCAPGASSPRSTPFFWGRFSLRSEVWVAVALSTQGRDIPHLLQGGFDSLRVPFPGFLCL